jgi:hypothetical protein
MRTAQLEDVGAALIMLGSGKAVRRAGIGNRCVGLYSLERHTRLISIEGPAFFLGGCLTIDPAPGQKRFHAALNLLDSHLSLANCYFG